MSFASLEYARQAREEYWEDRVGERADSSDSALSLPGASFTLWTAPIATRRFGTTDFRTDGWECISVEDERGHGVGYEYRDGSLLMAMSGFGCPFYWPAERKERHNLGGRLS